MLSILDLPPEIRNQIWDICLVSPTGAIRSVSRRNAFHLGYQSSISPSGPFFYLVVDETNFLIRNSHTINYGKKPRTISLSLPRTCRQIYNETNGLFWRSNTFYFRSPYSLTQTFKGMGRFPFRCITSIRLELCPALGNELVVFDLAIQLLTRQAKSSQLRHLELVLSLDSIIHMANIKSGQDYYFGTSIAGLKLTYERILASLNEVQHLHILEKKLLIHDEHNLGTEETAHELAVAEKVDGVLREIHQTWGGEPHWGSIEAWVAKEGFQSPDNVPHAE